MPWWGNDGVKEGDFSDVNDRLSEVGAPIFLDAPYMSKKCQIPGLLDFGYVK